MECLQVFLEGYILQLFGVWVGTGGHQGVSKTWAPAKKMIAVLKNWHPPWECYSWLLPSFPNVLGWVGLLRNKV